MSENTVTTEQPAEKPSKIKQIISLHIEGKTNAEIVALGFNKTTVSIQVAKHKKSLESQPAEEARV